MIGFMVTFPAQIYELDIISETHFYDPTRRAIFSGLRGIYSKSGGAGLETMASILATLTSLGVNEGVAVEVITESHDHAPQTIAGIKPVIEAIAAAGVRRAMADAGQTITGLAKSSESADVIQSMALEAVNLAVKGSTTIAVKSMAEVMQREIERMERDEADLEENHGLRYGLSKLDSMTDGAHGGEYIILGARPSVGKSALLLHFIQSFALDQAAPGLVFSCEMNAESYAQRLICGKARADIQQARLRLLTPSVRADYIDWAKKMELMQLYCYDTGGVSIATVSALTRRLVHESGIKWMAIDYLQLMDHAERGGGENRNSAITRTSNGLKALAVSLNIPVIVLSQLNRDCEKRDNKRPRMADLRESGSIEQDADQIMFLYRGSMHLPADEQEIVAREESDVAEIILSKQRNGPIGTAKVGFLRTCAGFYDLPDSGVYGG